jgi:hypothetical protein
MTLDYSLTENLLTAAPNDMMAQPVNVTSYGLSDIIRRILARNTGLSQVQVTTAFDEVIEECCRIVAEGGGFNTPLVNAQPSIPGVFHSAADAFDPKRHRVKINLTPGTRLKKAAASVKTRKVQMSDPLPFIIEVHDILSGAVNELITPGGVIQIRGGRLKLIAENPENGVFLTGDSGQAFKLNGIVENKPARLIAMLPADLPQGTYTLEVRTTLTSSNKESKILKTGRFLRELETAGD